MNKLSLREFSMFCSDRKLVRFVFSSDMQMTGVPAGIVFKFNCQIVQYMVHPNTICFKSEDNYIHFTGVKRIELIEPVENGAYRFKIVCVNCTNEREELVYSFVANREIVKVAA